MSGSKCCRSGLFIQDDVYGGPLESKADGERPCRFAPLTHGPVHKAGGAHLPFGVYPENLDYSTVQVPASCSYPYLQ